MVEELVVLLLKFIDKFGVIFCNVIFVFVVGILDSLLFDIDVIEFEILDFFCVL